MKRYLSTTLGFLALAACSTNQPAEDASSSYAEMEPASATSADTATGANTTGADTTRADTTNGDADTMESRNEASTSTSNAASDKASREDTAPAVANAPANTQPDNTKKNQRDRKDIAVTPIDQGNNETDLTITQKIRQAVMSDGSLSFNAKNVKIITVGGKVTLRGPVNSAEERATIEAAARRVAGATSVDNQLEVKK